MALRRTQWFVAATLAAVVSSISLLAYHAVDTSVTAEDEEYIARYLADGQVAPLPSLRTYEDELTFIRGVQKAVLQVAPEHRGIEDDHPREPRDVYMARAGLCYDRSRVIEKILRHAGFEARHVFILSTDGIGSGLRALLTPGVASHAVTEVRTERGWLIVGSNTGWLSIDVDGNPRSVKDLAAAPAGFAWQEKPRTDIYERPLVAIYGLYSRHGRFFPPYNALPDVNYTELAQNLW
jgi:hypothetical protein